MKNIKYSVSNKFKNKEPLGSLKDYSTSFMNVETDLKTFFEVIKNGWAVASQFDGTRSSENFLQTNLIMVDVDKGLKIEEVVKNPFYQKYAAGLYTTASHNFNSDEDKFRIVFVTERLITSGEDFTRLCQGLINLFHGDEVVKDPARLLYGSTEAIYEIHGKILSNDAIDVLIDSIKPPVVYAVQKNYEPPSSLEKQWLLDEIEKQFLGNYNKWRMLGWAMREGGFTIEDFIRVTNSVMLSKTVKDCNNIWNSYQNGRISLGWIYNRVGGRKKYLKTVKLTDLKHLV